jgi:uncharacterized membrane protein
METTDTTFLLDAENNQLRKLRDIVNDTLREEKLIVDNLLHPPAETLSIGQRVSDKVARFGGSWMFIISFLMVLGVWIAFNVLAVSRRFDPYPFILMNLILSCIAALQAPVIMMSQNRKEENDRMRAENDYMVNMKAEMEIRRLHQKLDLLIEEQFKTLFDSQASQMETLREINRKLYKLSSK